MHSRELTNEQLAELVRSQTQVIRAETKKRFDKIDARLDGIEKKIDKLRASHLKGRYG